MQQYTELILIINAFLLGVIGYFAKGILSKIDQTARAMTQIDKSVAVLTEKLATNRHDMDVIENELKRLEKEIAILRESKHYIMNEMNKIVLKQESCPARESFKNKENL